jgi:hypothetical protein
VIRTEITRALYENQLTDGVEIAIKVAIIGERISTQFGTPSPVRTYSVELRGRSRGGDIMMLPNSPFEWDPLSGRRPLEQHARQVASNAVDAVRASAKGRP